MEAELKKFVIFISGFLEAIEQCNYVGDVRPSFNCSLINKSSENLEQTLKKRKGWEELSFKCTNIGTKVNSECRNYLMTVFKKYFFYHFEIESPQNLVEWLSLEFAKLKTQTVYKAKFDELKYPPENHEIIAFEFQDHVICFYLEIVG